MTRDSTLFLGFIGIFVILNAILLVGGYLDMSWTSLGVITAAGLTVSLYSFLYRDNPLFKLASISSSVSPRRTSSVSIGIRASMGRWWSASSASAMTLPR